jgi:hypothetical protein
VVGAGRAFLDPGGSTPTARPFALILAPVAGHDAPPI